MNLFRKLLGTTREPSSDGDNRDAQPNKSVSDSPPRRTVISNETGTPFQQLTNERDANATAGGAIAAEWSWRGGTSGCWIPEHETRNGRVYAVRGNWAEQKGFMTAGDAYTDEITKPLEEDKCRCMYVYLYALRNLPDAMVTAAGKESLARARRQIEADRRRRSDEGSR
jgi:hypothetical protein